jgi:hypothetical protein
MKHYITQSANALSQTEAQRRGCQGTTTHWWSIRTHPTDGRTALVVPDADVGLLPKDAVVLDDLLADWTQPALKVSK